MAAGILYTYPQSFRANKVLIAAKYSGADVKLDDSFKLGETNTSPSFLKKFPNGKVPAFEGKDGFCLAESNAIAYYVANKQLQGDDAQSMALVQQWISFSDSEILPAACTWVFPCLGIIQYNKQETERAKEQIKRVLLVLNEHLLTRTFVVGEHLTLADISLVCNLESLYEQVLEPEFRKPYQNVNRWFTTMINQPHVKSVLGEVKLCTKMAVFDAKKYKELHGGAGDEKKKEKPQQQQPKKAKAAKPAKKEEEDDEDEPPKPKESKDPFAALPKGTFVFDDFKKVYSNACSFDNSVPYFWSNFDKETCSLWYCEYIETDVKEFPMAFMASNLVQGMFQRLDKLRKNAFGTMFILGPPKDMAIKGLWFWRSKDLAFELSPDWNVDYPSYSWTKVDPDSDRAKELITQFFTLGEKDDPEYFDGKEILDKKVFK